MFYPRRLFALLCVLVSGLGAQTTYVAPALPGTPEVERDGSLEVARNGKEVMLTWTLPKGEVRLMEIFRHTQSQPQGRGRVAGVRTEPSFYLDEVPEVDATYWYWLKITRTDGKVINIGPVSTPSATVWTP